MVSSTQFAASALIQNREYQLSPQSSGTKRPRTPSIGDRPEYFETAEGRALLNAPHKRVRYDNSTDDTFYRAFSETPEPEPISPGYSPCSPTNGAGSTKPDTHGFTSPSEYMEWLQAQQQEAEEEVPMGYTSPVWPSRFWARGLNPATGKWCYYTDETCNEFVDDSDFKPYTNPPTSNGAEGSNSPEASRIHHHPTKFGHHSPPVRSASPAFSPSPARIQLPTINDSDDNYTAKMAVTDEVIDDAFGVFDAVLDQAHGRGTASNPIDLTESPERQISHSEEDENEDENQEPYPKGNEEKESDEDEDDNEDDDKKEDEESDEDESEEDEEEEEVVYTEICAAWLAAMAKKPSFDLNYPSEPREILQRFNTIDYSRPSRIQSSDYASLSPRTRVATIEEQEEADSSDDTAEHSPSPHHRVSSPASSPPPSKAQTPDTEAARQSSNQVAWPFGKGVERDLGKVELSKDPVITNEFVQSPEHFNEDDEERFTTSTGEMYAIWGSPALGRGNVFRHMNGYETPRYTGEMIGEA